MMIILKNDFHNTTAGVYPKREGAYLVLNAKQVKRANEKLCPCQECTCCDFLGARGHQRHYFEPTQNGGAMYFSPKVCK